MINTKYKIPYAVQYKESDYRFISRLAHRYGEFFYYNGTQLIFQQWSTEHSRAFWRRWYDRCRVWTSDQTSKLHLFAYDAETAGTEQKKTQEVHLQDKVNPFQFCSYQSLKQSLYQSARDALCS